MTDYLEFLATKIVRPTLAGFVVATEDINPRLFPFQREIVRWALRLGRAAIFAGVGLGKTGMQAEWASHVARQTGKPVLILCPLAVAEQTVRDCKDKFDIDIRHIYEPEDIGDARIVITNYERVDRFDAGRFGGVVLDESSILKHYSKTFFDLCQRFQVIPYRLCCTATPSPNDIVEIGNHSTFLDIMDFHDVLARWFVGEGDIARKARLKAHARDDFWRWVTSWSVCISHPRDLGKQFDMPGYDLPPLEVHEYRLGDSAETIRRNFDNGKLLNDRPSATGFMRVKRDSLAVRVEKTREIVAALPPDEPVIIWCDTDFEADALAAALPEAIEVRGKYSPKVKEDRLKAFTFGEARMIITKPELAGFGLNWQHAANMIFAGVSFSFERTFQGIGRIYRFGQKRTAHIHLIYAESEGDVMQLLLDKQRGFDEMQREMNAAMRVHGLFREESGVVTFSETETDIATGKNWTMHLGDCVEVARKMAENSVDLSIHSPPFSSLYTYSDKEADMGNSTDDEQFFAHYGFLVKELLRVTKPGRACAVHVKDLPLFINRDEVMGINPFSDNVVALFRQHGWVLQSRITVGKDPVLEMRKTNSHGLLYKNWRENAQALRVGLPDYVLVFRKWPRAGETVDPVRHDPKDLTYHGANPPRSLLNIPSRGKGEINASLPTWQRYANPIWDDVDVPCVWQDIDQTNVLNYEIAKGDKDERHICPLQLDLIARLVQWYTNPGELVYDPFAGIGSTLYEAVKAGRQGVGSELKPEYWRLSQRYLREAEMLRGQPTLYDLLPAGGVS
jgi:DNA modification methylase